MPLKELMSKKSLTLLGLNSGTSADGVDLAIVEVNRKGSNVSCKFSGGHSAVYPRHLRQSILKLADSTSTTLEEIISTDKAIGEFFGRTASGYLKKLSKRGQTVHAIASHGQTVRHIPTKRSKTQKTGTLQLGSLEQIATHADKITVGDFRQADVALGHEGAPITVAAMKRLFASSKESRLIVNIGGISNFFYFPADNLKLNTLAADCGPGNVLCDILSEKLFHKSFDKNGIEAQKGRPSRRILTLLLAEPMLRKNTISTGRESFGRKFADRIIALGKKFDLSKQDIISTAAELTAIAICNQIRPIISKDKTITKLYLTGGGRKNTFFVKRLKEMLNGINILSADQLGIDADYIEAAAYAVMGEATLRSEPLPTVFNGRPKAGPLAVLGKIVQPPVKK